MTRPSSHSLSPSSRVPVPSQLGGAGQPRERLLVRWLRKLLSMAAETPENDNAERAKAKFLANISHELRTPLHAILSYAQLGRDASGGEQREYFDRITHCGQQLLRMLNNLLDLSQLEAGKIRVELAENDLLALARDALTLAADSFESKQVHVHIERTSDCPSCRAAVDAVLMGKLLDNLLSNAARYSPQGGNVRIGFASSQLEGNGARQRPALELTIADEGIGIPESELDLVFQKFVQSSKTRSNAGGAGLGLAICREIVALHGGKIWASNNRAAGTTLHVVLPLADEAQSAAPRTSSGSRTV